MTDESEVRAPKGLAAQAGGFFIGSLAGVATDLVAFQLLVMAGVNPGIANFISSGLAITVTFALVTRYAFSARATVRNYLLFFGWYAISITAFSLAIAAVAGAWDVAPLIVKLLSLPVSFVVNFLASRYIFHGRTP